MSDYQLRYAAGKYWLLDMGQKGFSYQSPVCLNETGAYLWRLFQKGLEKEEIARLLSVEYGLEWEEAWQDTNEFFHCFR
jgi:hypothetical protein